MSNHMNALSLASAKHLLNQGHITPAHHARIVAAVSQLRKPKKPQAVAGFGSLAGAQQAQAPVPGIGAAPSSIPDGTASGY